MSIDSIHNCYMEFEKKALKHMDKKPEKFSLYFSAIIHLCTSVGVNGVYQFGVFADADQKLIDVIKQKCPNYVYYDCVGDDM